jgi:hypothetical protein
MTKGAVGRCLVMTKGAVGRCLVMTKGAVRSCLVMTKGAVGRCLVMTKGAVCSKLLVPQRSTGAGAAARVSPTTPCTSLPWSALACSFATWPAAPAVSPCSNTATL